MASAQGEIKVSLDTEQLQTLLDKITNQEQRIAALEDCVAALERTLYRVATDLNGGA